jgi:acetyl esterase/lipase
MFTRKEVNPKQVKLLLEAGFLPVSIEYRFCPEINIIEGAMTDVCDALSWARNHLPTMPLDCPGLQIDPSRVAVVGWSAGGHRAMTTAITTGLRGIQPPDAILAFYCPTDYESDCK